MVPKKPTLNSISEEAGHDNFPRHQDDSSLLRFTMRPPNITRANTTGVETDESPAVIQCLRDKHSVPWFQGKDWRETYLVFYGKPIMLVLKSIGRRRGWKVKLILKDSSSGLQELQSLISNGRLLIIIANSRAYRHPIIKELANSNRSLVSTIENVYKVTGAKKTQLSMFRAHFQLFGCSLEDSEIMPRSYIVSDAHQCTRFFKYAYVHPNTWWILKPSDGYGGEGISIYSNLTLLYKKFGSCAKRDDYIIQEYLSDVLLLEKRKFDIRALILISGTSPYLLFHHEGYLRVSVKQFSLAGGRSAHLTNTHVQFTDEDFLLEKHFWSYQQLQDYLDEHHPENNEFVSNRLVPFIHKISLFILQTGE